MTSFWGHFLGPLGRALFEPPRHVIALTMPKYGGPDSTSDPRGSQKWSKMDPKRDPKRAQKVPKRKVTLWVTFWGHFGGHFLVTFWTPFLYPLCTRQSDPFLGSKMTPFWDPFWTPVLDPC